MKDMKLEIQYDNSPLIYSVKKILTYKTVLWGEGQKKEKLLKVMSQLCE